MFRSVSALALVTCGLLAGCGGQPGEEESLQGPQTPDTQAAPSEVSGRPVSASAVYAAAVTGAYVTFNSYGDHLIVQDTAADGHSALGILYNYNSGTYFYCWNSRGAGTTVDCNYNFAEGITVAFFACTAESGDGTLIACSPATYANTAN
jgi:hypothetical protein